MTTQSFTDRLAAKRTASDTPTVNRRDITVHEEGETSLAAGFIRTAWIAELSGRLSTGEQVTVSIWGDSAARALIALEAKIGAEGWAIK